MKPVIISFMLLAAASSASVAGKTFEDNFSDSTLRVDYTFSGLQSKQTIALSQRKCTPGWFGRRVNMDRLPQRGKGRIVMTDAATGDTLYVNPFSSLFLEWIDTDESKDNQLAMHESYLLPMPLRPVKVTVEIDNHRKEPIATVTNLIDPKDILIQRPKVNETTPYRYIRKAGDPKDKIDVAILAEGYTVAEMDSFYRHAETAVASILSHEPFRQMADRFNFIAVASPSKDSGVSVPRFNDWKRTAFSSSYSTFYSDRYLTTTHVPDIHDALIGIPYEHLMILANTEEYGGGGIYNSYTLTTSRNPKFWPVVTHEFGHSFGGLADEYFYDNSDAVSDTYPVDVEPWEQNVTTLVDFNSKWADMLDKGTKVPTQVSDPYKLGVYEGAAYSTKGLYRPFDRCRMRDNEFPEFCPVCQRTLMRIIEFHTEEQK